MSLISVITLVVCTTLVASYPQSMYFYRSPYSYNNPAQQQAMYMQLYSQPLRAQQPSGVSTYVSGNYVKAGSYLKDAEYIRQRKVNGKLNAVTSVAEAYPEGNEPESFNDEIPQDEVYQSDLPVADPEQDVPVYDAPPVQADTPVAVKPKKTTKVEVQLDTQDDDDDDDDYPPPRRGSSSKGSNVYFPIKFGNTNGGAIAIANAFSNGKGGTAASRATAYGNPTKKRV